ncbi:MAG: pentapeptide repeat-containing protein [Fimbriimonadaceae bacterium]|nr:pentapeptide repeat-containing protein [Fimbriimonadaceae bacterium]
MDSRGASAHDEFMEASETKLPRKFAKLYEHHKLAIWFALALLTGVSGSLSILTFAGVTLLPQCPAGIHCVRVPTLDKSSHGAVVNAAFSWLAGLLGLYMFFMNREQKERHQREQESRERDSLKQREDHQRYTTKFGLYQLERQRIEADFSQKVSDLNNEDSASRCLAVIGISEIATLRAPKFSAIYQPEVVPSPAHEDTDHSDIEKSESYFPYFRRTSSRLIALAQQWTVDTELYEVQRALDYLIRWAKDPGHTEPLLRSLTQQLADANRECWQRVETYFRRLSDCGATQGALDVLGETLGSDTSARDYLAAIAVAIPSKKMADGGLMNELDRFTTTVKQFDLISRCLASACSSLSYPSALPWLTYEFNWSQDPLEEIITEWTQALQEHEDLLNATLKDSKVFFTGVRLFDKHIVGANLQNAYLFDTVIMGGRFHSSRLTGANIQNCHFVNLNANGLDLSFASCSETSFENCNLGFSYFVRFRGRRCSFMDASLTCCNLYHCNFEACNFVQANFAKSAWVFACVRRCSFRQSTIRDAIFGWMQFCDSDFIGTEFVNIQFRCGTFVTCDFTESRMLLLQFPTGSKPEIDQATANTLPEWSPLRRQGTD